MADPVKAAEGSLETENSKLNEQGAQPGTSDGPTSVETPMEVTIASEGNDETKNSAATSPLELPEAEDDDDNEEDGSSDEESSSEESNEFFEALLNLMGILIVNVTHCIPVQVETIVSHKKVGGKNYYKIRWHHFSAKDDTWEPEENLVGSNIPQLVEAFWTEQREKKNKKKKGKAGAGVKKQAPKKEKVVKEKSPELAEEARMEEQDAGEDAEGNESWFGIKPDDASRETRRLFVADRVVTQTEKVGGEIGRVNENCI